MTVLEEHQFEILPSAEAFDGFVFGIGAEVSVGSEGFDPGQNDWQTQDANNTRRGVVGFGRDVLGPKTWVWESHVNRDDVYEAVDTLERFSAAWAPQDIMENPGAQTALRYRLAGRDRRVFGRPRRYAAPPTNMILNGYTDVTHDFQCVDSYTYDDVETSVEILYSSAVEGGGFVFPATMPILTMPSDGNGAGAVTVGGNARAYPIIRFNGAWTNPVLVTDDWTLRWNGEVPSGGWVEVDLRPWALTVLDHSGASRVEGIERRTWMQDAWFAPQSQPQISLGGVAPGGSASATVRFRNTWTSI